jgi:4-hydroxy-tetrahydrodipicolinate reductase
MIKIGLVGASGRTGRFVVEALAAEDKGAVLHAALVSSTSKYLGQSVPQFAGNKGGMQLFYSDNLEALSGSDVVIEFTEPETSVRVAEWCGQNSVPLLLATTGHTDKQLALIKDCAQSIALAITPNTSLGAAVVTELALKAKGMLGASFDIEILDIHHRMKRDAPSGTALSIVQPLVAAANGGSEVIYARKGARKEGEIGISSLRGGDVVGDHTVFLLGDGERIEVTHRVNSRAVFGMGAVAFAKRLCGLKRGIYGARELLLMNDA